MAGVNRTTGKATDLITFSRASGGTYLDSDGLLKTASNNIPRIDYAADGTVKGLLIEEARTNLVTYSEDFTNASWVNNNTAALAIDASGPDGETSAVTLVDSGATGSGGVYIRSNVVTSTSTSYTASCFMKADQLSWGLIFISSVGPSGNGGCYFDLENGAVGTADAGFSGAIQPMGGGWYRCSVTFTSNAVTTAGQLRLYVSDGDATVDLDGTSSILIYGAQFEAGSFPTSYIPTSGATATRAADIASISVDNFGYRQDAGTVVVEWEQSESNNGAIGAVLDDGTFSNRVALFTDAVTGGGRVPGLYVTVGGVAQVAINHPTISANSENTLASSYSVNDFASSLNGATALTDTSGSLPVVTDMNIGISGTATAGFLNGHIKSIQYYPRRLSNAQLQELTA